MTRSTTDLLAAIVACARRIVEVRREAEPLDALARRAASARPRRQAFVEALSRDGAVHIIAECKRRSPSRGVLRREYDPAALATEYAAAGAAAVSVLTEPAFFDGRLAHLEAVRRAVAIPLLRKDFIVDEYQLFEARAAGADAALLIVAALGPGRRLRDLVRRADDLELAVLVEAHDLDEVRAAVDAGAAVVGVNNRNLRTLAVDLSASLELAAAIPPDVVAVAESGLRTGEDVRRLRAGYDAFLVGERLMSDERPGEALAGLLREATS